ncbi:COG1470 family protein [Streptomyces rubiginosohelvolus]
MSPPTPRRRALPVLTAALAALLCGIVQPAAADDPPPDWTARPAGGSTDRDARPYVYLEGTPGTVLQDRLTVTNSGRAPLTVRLRGDGRAGGWIRFAEDTVTVPARTRADVPLALTVPHNAVPGDSSGEAVATGGGEEIRVPVRVRTVGPTLAALGVEDVQVSGGTIRYALVNRGNAMLRPRLAVRAEGVFGTLLDRPERPLPLELAPGRRVERTEPWPDAPALDAVTVRLRVTASGGARDEAEASATYLPVAPAVGGGLLVLGGLAALASGAHRRRRTGRAAPQPPLDATPAVQPEPPEQAAPPVEAHPPVDTEPLLKAGAKT